MSRAATTWLLWAVACTCSAEGRAEAGQPLPEPLTLAYVLSLADEAHPDVERVHAAMEASRAEVMAAEASDNFSARVRGRVRWVETSDDERASRDGHDDHAAQLFVTKRLYDFGRTRAMQAAASAQVREREALLVGARQAHRIEIMTSFFDVLLADLRYARVNEDMAVAFVAVDKLRDRHSLGQVSDIELLAAESDYQTIRAKRQASEAAQRATRSRLALVLNRPGQLPAQLLEPELPGNARSLPDAQELENRALEGNSRVNALRARLEAAQQRVAEARAGNRPVINGELEAAAYSRVTRTRDPLRAGVVLEMPIYTGGRRQAEVAQRRAEVSKVRSELASHELEVRQAVLDLWLELNTLHIQRQQATALSDYRDLYLDRSRALYEMEVKTDLGDSMARTTEARLRQVEVEYQITLAWARLDAVLGVEPETIEANALKGDTP